MSDSSENADAAAPEEPPYPSAAYGWYVVAVLMAVYVFSFVDRQILSLMVGELKDGLNISKDWQVSILMGPAFAVFYAIFGIPFGRLADSKSRRVIIGFGLIFWSLMTGGCALIKNFWQMAILRTGVGVGEASLSPSAYSLITDTFPRNKLATALSVYGTGIYIGSGLAYLIGGAVLSVLLNQPAMEVPIFGTIAPWQKVFLYIGIPGMLFAPILMTIKEPYRRGGIKASTGDSDAPAVVPLGEVFAYMWKNKATIATHNLGFALLAFSGYGSAAWIPTMFKRVHGWDAGKFGLTYGSIVIVAGTAGIIFGGILADRLRKGGRLNSKILVGMIAGLIWLPTGMAFPLLSNDKLAMALVAPTVFFAAMPFGVAPAALQELMPNNMRGQASAIYLFVVNMIGLGVGPLLLGIMNDQVFTQADGVRYSLLTVTTGAHLLGGTMLFLCLKPYLRSLERVAKETAG